MSKDQVKAEQNLGVPRVETKPTSELDAAPSFSPMLRSISLEMSAWLKVNPNATATHACFELMRRVESALADEVSKALRELREMLPEVVFFYVTWEDALTYDDGKTTHEAVALILVGGARAFRGATLSEAMAKVREWKEQDNAKS